MKKYVALNGGFGLNSKILPNEVGPILEQLPEDSRTPQVIVDMAADETSPLHKYFDWDDHSAATKYRLQQARNLILSIGIETPSGDIRGFVNLRVESLGSVYQGYFSTDNVASSASLMNQAMDSIINEILYFREKHEKFRAYFGNLFAAIDETEKAWRNKNEESKKGGKRRSHDRKAGTDRRSKAKA